jgi:hypothetical protein
MSSGRASAAGEAPTLNPWWNADGAPRCAPPRASAQRRKLRLVQLGQEAVSVLLSSRQTSRE